MKYSSVKPFVELVDLIPGETYVVRVFLKGNDTITSSPITFETSPGEKPFCPII